MTTEANQEPKNINNAGTLSVVIPVYNEEKTIKQVIEEVLDNPLVGEIIVVNDCSKDDSQNIIEQVVSAESKVKLFNHDVNQGKGAALRTGFEKATKAYVIVQDADREYDSKEFIKVVQPLIEDRCDVCYGSRYLKNNPRRVLRFWHTMGNKFLTTLSNMATDLHVTDMETCYKAFKREVIQAIDIKENRFGFEPEVTAKIARKNLRVCEVAISYYPRSVDEGKHIGWKDGMRAIWCITKYGVFKR